jgi:hypothetical protein
MEGKIMKKKRISKVIIALAIFIYASSNVKAQDIVVENIYQERFGFEINYSPIKNLDLNFEPEIRMSENFTDRRYLMNIGAEYKVIEYLRLEANYRYEAKYEDGESDSYHRYGLGMTGRVKVRRVTPSIRLLYTNDGDDFAIDKQFFRYRGLLKYDIKSCKLTPFFGVEGFYELGDYSMLYKTRYIAGGSFKLNKKQSIKFSYKLDYFNTEYKNKHIFSLGYKYKF